MLKALPLLLLTGLVLVGGMVLFPTDLSAVEDMRQVTESWAASHGDRVTIEVPAGRLQVIGWDRREVALEGRLGAGVSPLQAHADGQKVRLVLTADEQASLEDQQVDLALHVPRRCRLVVQGFSAEVEVRDVLSFVEVQTLDGDIRISGRPDEVKTRTLRGHQTLDIESRRLTSRGLEGTLRVSGAVHFLEASSVTGAMDIDSRLIGEMKLRSTSGRISFSGEILPTGRLDVETTGGRVDFDLVDGSHADVHLETRSGSIAVDAGSINGEASLDARDESAVSETTTDSHRGGPRRHIVLGDGGPRLTAVSQWGDLHLVYRLST